MGMFTKIRKKLGRQFLAGLVVLLPAVITFYLLFIIFKFADGLLGRYINQYLKEALGYYVPGIGLILTLLIVLLVGVLARSVFLKKMVPAIESWFAALPLVRNIYPPSKQIVKFFLSDENKAMFKRVVLVEYPRKGLYSLGFVTNEGFEEAAVKLGRQDLVTVLIAGTPSPFTGYFVLLPREEIIFLDMSIEDGFKMVISAGILTPADVKSLVEKKT